MSHKIQNKTRFDLYIINPASTTFTNGFLVDNWKYYLICYNNGEIWSYDFFDDFAEMNKDLEHDESYSLDASDLENHTFLKSYGSIEEIIADYPESLI